MSTKLVHSFEKHVFTIVETGHSNEIIFVKMSSSSSDSEDENIALLRQAVDTNFISDGMFSAGK